jgi:hypothetical protein
MSSPHFGKGQLVGYAMLFQGIHELVFILLALLRGVLFPKVIIIKIVVVNVIAHCIHFFCVGSKSSCMIGAQYCCLSSPHC